MLILLLFWFPFWQATNTPIYKLPQPAPNEHVILVPGHLPIWEFEMGQGLRMTINPDGSNSIIVDQEDR